jgi:hypothetical protein
MTTVLTTTGKLIEALRAAQRTVSDMTSQLRNSQPRPKIGDVWKDSNGELFIVTNNDESNIVLFRLSKGWAFAIGELTKFLLNYEKVGTTDDLFLSLEEESGGPIEQDKDLPKFRPFTQEDWYTFAGATAFAEGILPHILELDWAVIVIDRTALQLFPRADLTDGYPECWQKKWTIPNMSLEEAIKCGEMFATTFKGSEDLRRFELLERIS